MTQRKKARADREDTNRKTTGEDMVIKATDQETELMDYVWRDTMEVKRCTRGRRLMTTTILNRNS